MGCRQELNMSVLVKWYKNYIKDTGQREDDAIYVYIDKDFAHFPF